MGIAVVTSCDRFVFAAALMTSSGTHQKKARDQENDYGCNRKTDALVKRLLGGALDFTFFLTSRTDGRIV